MLGCGRGAPRELTLGQEIVAERIAVAESPDAALTMQLDVSKTSEPPGEVAVLMGIASGVGYRSGVLLYVPRLRPVCIIDFVMREL